jgi:hypothetical protein
MIPEYDARGDATHIPGRRVDGDACEELLGDERGGVRGRVCWDNPLLNNKYKSKSRPQRCMLVRLKGKLTSGCWRESRKRRR